MLMMQIVRKTKQHWHDMVSLGGHGGRDHVEEIGEWGEVRNSIKKLREECTDIRDVWPRVSLSAPVILGLAYARFKKMLRGISSQGR